MPPLEATQRGPAARPGSRPARGTLRSGGAIAVLLPALLTFLGFLAVRPAAWFADDLVLLGLLDATGRIPWAEVTADFTSPWLASEVWTYYRPLGTVVFKLWTDLVGVAPEYLDLAGGLAHAANAALLAALVLRLLPGHALPAGAAAVLFAVHPAAAETATWFSAITGILQWTCFLGAAHCWLAFLRGGRHRAAFAAGLLAFAATLFKESGLAAVPLLAVVDLVERGRPLAALRRMLPLAVPVWLASLALRHFSMASTSRAAPSVGFAAANLFDGLGIGLWPEVALVAPALARGLVLAVLAAAVVAALRRRLVPLALLFATAWMLGPSLAILRDAHGLGGRALYSSSACAAALWCLLLVAARRDARGALPRTAAWLLFAAHLAGTVVASGVAFDAMRATAAQGTRVHRGLEAAAAATGPGEPIGLVAFPGTHAGHSAVMPELVSALPLHGRGPDDPSRFAVLRGHEALGSRLVLEAGGRLAGPSLDPAHAVVLLPVRAPTAPLEQQASGARLSFARAGPPLALEVLRITPAPGTDARALTLHWLAPDGSRLPQATRLRLDQGAAEHGAFDVDLQAIPELLLLVHAGGLFGVEAELEGPAGEPAPVVAIAAVPCPRLPLVPKPPATAEIAARTAYVPAPEPAGLAHVLRAPACADAYVLSCLLLTGVGAFEVEVEPGAPVDLDVPTRQALAWLLQLHPTQTIVASFLARDGHGGLRARTAGFRLELRAAR